MRAGREWATKEGEIRGTPRWRIAASTASAVRAERMFSSALGITTQGAWPVSVWFSTACPALRMRSYFLWTFKSTGLTCHAVSGLARRRLARSCWASADRWNQSLTICTPSAASIDSKRRIVAACASMLSWLGFLRVASKISGTYQEPNTMPVLPLGGRSFQ
ncbi:hypothetical protein FQZ97_974580 [compost metagenome]